ncbi:hypothetical protein BHE74_00043141 [Ensete ventricosum]|nr:hypothetical protein BHE74_00043141 [Ensete ventricosum]
MLRPGVMCGRRAAGELDCSSAYIRLREPGKSEDKTEGVEVGGRKGRRSELSPEGLSYPKAKRRPELRWTRRSATMTQRRIYRSRKKRRRCEATDSNAMGLAAPWYSIKGERWS